MKSSLKKLQRLALNHGGGHNHSKERRPAAAHDELTRASQDVKDIRDCYDSLLSAAAATANSAYEFSEALQELGSCLLQRTALNEDEESGRVLLMLGKVQFELQKLVDSYRGHVIQTITTPSESLLKELQNVEEMKRQCDDKRELYKFMLAAHREKGRSRHVKSETVSSLDLQEAKEAYHEEATLFIFRLKSLKQGQSRSFLTQAARHHAAQLNFFRKGMKSLEEVEPHVKMIAEQQHIDYHFSALQDDYTDSYEDDDDDDDGSSFESDFEGELSFDYRKNDRIQSAAAAKRNSMELDQVNYTSPVSSAETVKENKKEEFFSSKVPPNFRQSAPIYSDKFEPYERIMAMRPSSTRKFHTYALPTPLEAKSSKFTSSGKPVSASLVEQKGERSTPLWHSSPLEPKKFMKDFTDDKAFGPTKLTKAESVLQESNSNNGAVKVPHSLVEGLSMSNPYSFASDVKNIKRDGFSGPLTSKRWSGRPMFATADSKPSVEFPKALAQRRSPKVSPAASPPLMSPPKISELHELPRPPRNPSSLIGHSAPLIGYSAPLTSKNQENYSKKPSPTSQASPLPTPPGPVLRSFSIPSSSKRTDVITVAKLLEAPIEPEEVTSPPLTPISLSNILQS